MIIPLNFLPAEKIFAVRCIVRAPNYHNAFGNVQFVIDTGSGASFIGETDAARIRIPVSKLEKDKETFGRGLAGGAIELYRLSNVIISFLDSKTSQVQRVQCNKFYVAKSASRKEEMKIRDNILGNDFLIDHKFKLVVNPHDESYLENV